jgi:hypothetical protein
MVERSSEAGSIPLMMKIWLFILIMIMHALF